MNSVVYHHYTVTMMRSPRYKIRMCVAFIAFILLFLCFLEGLSLGSSKTVTMTQQQQAQQVSLSTSSFSLTIWDQFVHKSVFLGDDDFEPEYRVTVLSNNESGVFLQIHEISTENQQETAMGGSYFIVTQQQGIKLHRRTVCPYKDHYNGYYTVACAYYDSEFSDITITAQFSTFSFFADGANQEGRNEVIFHQKFNRPLGYSLNNFFHSLSQIIPIDQPPVFSWRTDSSSQCTHLEYKGRMIELLPSSRLLSCFQPFTEINILGTDDMKILAKKLSFALDNSATHVKYTEINTLEKLLSHLQVKFTAVHSQAKRKRLIVVQIPDSDVSISNLQYSGSTTIAKIMKFLQLMHGNMKMTVHVMTMRPAMSAITSRTVQQAAFNAAIISAASKLHINVTNIYDEAYTCMLAKQNTEQYNNRIDSQLYERGFLYRVCSQIEAEKTLSPLREGH